jgi:hypothetical protein
MGAGSKKQTVGYEYSMGVQLALCHGPVDAVTELIIGERSAWTGSVTSNQTILVNKPNLFGGKSREGGVFGAIDICMGGPDQQKNPYMARLLDPLPAYRGVLTTVFHSTSGTSGFTWSSMNPYFKAPWWRIRRILNGWSQNNPWYPARARIGDLDMNPVHMIYECLTNTEWGMGYAATEVDDASFRKAADVLYAENFGISMMWMEQTSLNDFIQMIVDHIDGALRTDVRDGKYKLRLIRNDYVVANLPTLDEDNILTINNFQRGGWGDTPNEVTVKYTDREQKEASVTLQDLASIQAQGRVIPTTREYVGARTVDLASRLGQRDLNLSSSPLSKITLTCTRFAWSWDVTDVFSLVWPRLGINGVPFRIIKIDKGNLSNNQITIDAVEDVFGMPLNAYINPQPPMWEDPVQPPQPVLIAKVFEAPYYDVVQAFSAADIAYFDPHFAFGEVAAVRPTSATFGYDLYASSNNSAFEQVGTGDFTPTGIVATAIPRGAGPVSFILNAAFDLDVDQVGTYAYIDNEAFLITALNPATGEVTALRAVIDTVPAQHAAGARMYFVDDIAGYDPTQRVRSETAYYRLLTRTGMGVLPLDQAVTYSKTFEGRAVKPYPPGNLQFNGQYFPAAVNGPFTLTWAHRDRIQQTAGLNEFRTGSIGPEPGTTYQVRVYDGEVLRRTYTGITGTSWTYPTADAILDGTIKSLRTVTSSARDGEASWQAHDVTVQRYGFGFRFGQQFGGAIPS